MIIGNSQADNTKYLRPVVINIYPHDQSVYTQGLLYHDGTFLESAGLYGRSRLRQTKIGSGRVVRELKLDDRYFAEGLALVDQVLLQLTWRRGVLLRYRLEDFLPLQPIFYTGEGWGLCFDGKEVLMSDGTHILSYRDSRTFEIRKQIPVILAGKPVKLLNELECVAGLVYANVWQSDEIMVIEKTSGQVRAVIDASALLTPAERKTADVLNGIAYNPQKETFYLTGKFWPKVFEVRFE